jgi:hypothetical protein
VVLKGTLVPRPVAAFSIGIGPGGEPKASPGSRLTPTPRRARVLRSIHIAHALLPLNH